MASSSGGFILSTRFGSLMALIITAPAAPSD
eukprot:CAMPEP_0173439312 /NCGR_PEP_ID=MMETSP1357-20121228/20887_1 /TAXON_ID=77926 /ORGANISM="Hemiselmis rufescens, Strain PCC563" /LENGTH=30 /DNA_ID= /DNA_START= /DNA_END= /DNA_ORIENTATION=